MITRRTALAAAGTALALPRVAAGQGKPTLQTLRSTAKSWIWMVEDYALGAGFFDKAGVGVVANSSGRGTNINALIGSSVDVEWGDPGEALNARKENLPFRTIGQTVGKFGSHVVVKSDILAKLGVTEQSPLEAKLAALKGLRMGSTGPGGAPDNLLRWLAVRGGMNPQTDMRLVPIQGGGPAIVAALQQGVIDGFCLSSPTSDLAVTRFGCGYLFNMVTNPPPEFRSYTYIICNTSERTLRDKRDALVRYVAGLAMAMRSMAADPEAFKAFAVPFLELDPSIAAPAYANNASMYYREPVLTEAQFATNVAFISTANKSAGMDPIPPTLTYASMYEPSVALEAMTRI
jgi:NitT/TauT family transport system substrate-binding protein